MRPLLVIAFVCGAAGAAAADSRDRCSSLEPDAIAVDGMLDDWQGADRVRVGGTDRDASFDVRCAVEGKSLALAFDVRDEHVVRSAVSVGPGDDLLTVKLGATTITIAPGLGSIPPQVQIDGHAAPKWLAAESTLQKAGWSVELVVPLARLRGWKEGAPELDAQVAYRDGDVMHGKAPERTVADVVVLELGGEGGGGSDAIDPDAPPFPSSPGGGGTSTATRPAPRDAMAAFLSATGLAKNDVTLDASAVVDPSSRASQRVVAGRRIVGLVADRFTYIELPAARDADVIARPRLVDLRGDGSRVIVAVVREDGTSGTRDVLLGFGAHAGSLAQLFAIEVRRERGAQRLESAWSIDKRQIVVRARPAVGWDADTYDEGPSGDAEPIALPWDDDRWGASYTLAGDALTSHRLPGRRPSK